MTCPHCSVDTVEFTVPPSLREYAPAEASAATLCPRCLRVAPLDGGSGDRDAIGFDAVGPFFPDGDAGVATALLVGLLDSLALNRRDIEAVAAYAEREGADVFLTLDRLAANTENPHLDLTRRLVQLEQVLE